jgi:hypothetical protein
MDALHANELDDIIERVGWMWSKYEIMWIR